MTSSSESFHGGNTFLWNRDPFYKLGELTGIHERIIDAAYAADGEYLVTADSVLRIWEVASLRQIEIDSLPASTVELSPDGELLAVGIPEGEIHLLSVPEGDTLAILEGGTETVTDLAFTEDGRSLYSVGHDGTLRLWALAPEPGSPVPDCTGDPSGTGGQRANRSAGADGAERSNRGRPSCNRPHRDAGVVRLRSRAAAAARAACSCG